MTNWLKRLFCSHRKVKVTHIGYDGTVECQCVKCGKWLLIPLEDQ